MPAFSTDVFFALLGATSRLHDLLALFRAMSRMLMTVTSPYKIALTLLVLLGVFAMDSERGTRGVVLLGVSVFACGSILPLLLQGVGIGAAPVFLLAGTPAIAVGCRSGARLLNKVM